MIDMSFAILGLLGALQLVLALHGVSLADFHKSANVVWGRSNYVADALVVIGLVVWGRMRVTRLPRPWRLIPLAILIGASLTLSRGAFLGLTGGVVASTAIGLRRRSGRRAVRAAFLVIAVLVGLYSFSVITTSRAVREGRSGLSQDVTVRQDLWSESWRLFLRSPIAGSGLGSLSSAPGVVGPGTALTYAHNVELSLLQQAGLLGLPFLVSLGFAVIAALRRDRALELRPAIIAALIMAQTEILFEGTAAGLLIWSVILAGAYGPLIRRGRRLAEVNS
jgi:O-antigen ligase